MGGADEAGRHPLERVRRGLLARAQFARALAGDVAERAPERAQAFPAGLERDVGDGQVGVAQQRLGALDAARQQIAVRRHAEGFLERAREVRLGDAAHARQPPTGHSSCEAASIRSFARSRRRSSSGSWPGSACPFLPRTPSTPSRAFDYVGRACETTGRAYLPDGCALARRPAPLSHKGHPWSPAMPARDDRHLVGREPLSHLVRDRGPRGRDDGRARRGAGRGRGDDPQGL